MSMAGRAATLVAALMTMGVAGWALAVPVRAAGPPMVAPAPREGTMAAPSAATPLRRVDWNAVLANDPELVYEDNPPYPASTLRIFVTATRDGGGEVSGHPLFEDVDYGDADGDGIEEAIIPLASGGTAGNVGLLLYREGPDRPELVLARGGYKLDVRLEGGRLVVYEPSYVGFEPNCCPSASTIATFRLVGDRLERLSYEVEPNDAQEVTVSGFYRALSAQDFESAYAFYSPAQKAANPYDRWREGHRDTLRIEVETSPSSAPERIEIVLTATDRAPNGGTVTKRFAGTWTLVWSADERRWLLDTANIAALP